MIIPASRTTRTHEGRKDATKIPLPKASIQQPIVLPLIPHLKTLASLSVQSCNYYSITPYIIGYEIMRNLTQNNKIDVDFRV